MMSRKSDRDAHALVEARFKQAQDLELKLRSLLASKGPLDPAVRDIRHSLREKYEYLILTDPEFAERNDIEFALWRLSYKRIEEFRARIWKLTATPSPSPSPAPSLSGPPPYPGSRGGAGGQLARREALQKITSVFRSFLAEASGFYHDLISKLKGRYGLPQDYSFASGSGSGSGEGEAAVEAEGLRRCQVSCHRCLIYLGDLARYKELNANVEPLLRDWSVAAGYYLQAAATWPGSGNPHNQLAVLATYVEDELLAVYRYSRSLAVEVPFPTARENLSMLFEKNRVRYAALVDSGGSGGSTEPGGSGEKGSGVNPGDRLISTGQGELKLALKSHSVNGGAAGQLEKNSARLPKLRKHFRIHFVRLNGIIFTKSSIETFADVYIATVRDLEELLALDDANIEAVLGSESRNGIGSVSAGSFGVIQLLVVLIFTLININHSPENHHPTYAEVLQKSELFQHSFTALFECSGRLVRRLMAAKQPLKSPIFPAVLIVLDFLASHSEMALGSEVGERQAKARSFFWAQIVNFLNMLLEGFEGEGGEEQTGGFDAHGTSVPLWEDQELKGFLPLIPVQKKLDYSKTSSRMGAGGAEQEQIRIRRVLNAGKLLSAVFKGSGLGLGFDEAAGSFFIAGQTVSPQQKISLLLPAENEAFMPERHIEIKTRENLPDLKGKEAGDDGVVQEEEWGVEGVENGLDTWEEEGQEETEGEPAWAMEDGREAPKLGEDEEKKQREKEWEMEQLRQLQHQEWQLNAAPLLGERGGGGEESYNKLETSPLQLQSNAAVEELDDEEVIVFRPAAAHNESILQSKALEKQVPMQQATLSPLPLPPPFSGPSLKQPSPPGPLDSEPARKVITETNGNVTPVFASAPSDWVQTVVERERPSQYMPQIDAQIQSMEHVPVNRGTNFNMGPPKALSHNVDVTLPSEKGLKPPGSLSLREWVSRGDEAAREVTTSPASNSGLNLALLSSLLGLPSAGVAGGINLLDPRGVQQSAYTPEPSYNYAQIPHSSPSQAYGMGPHSGYQQPPQMGTSSLESLLGALSNFRTSAPSSSEAARLHSSAPYASPYPPGSLGDIAARLYGTYQGNNGQNEEYQNLEKGLLNRAAAVEEGSAARGGSSITTPPPSHSPYHKERGSQIPSSLFMQNDPLLPVGDRVHRYSTPPPNGVIGRMQSGGSGSGIPFQVGGGPGSLLAQNSHMGSGWSPSNDMNRGVGAYLGAQGGPSLHSVGDGFDQSGRGLNPPPHLHSQYPLNVGGGLEPVATLKLQGAGRGGGIGGGVGGGVGGAVGGVGGGGGGGGEYSQVQPWPNSAGQEEAAYANDDYGWLDQYTHVKPKLEQWEGAAASHWGGGKNASTFSSNANTVSNISGGGIRDSGDTILPFPGMRFPQQHKEQLQEWKNPEGV